MAKKLDAERIEQARQQGQKADGREQEKQRIRDTIAKNRRGERKVTVIQPEHKEYACQDASAKLREYFTLMIPLIHGSVPAVHAMIPED